MKKAIFLIFAISFVALGFLNITSPFKSESHQQDSLDLLMTDTESLFPDSLGQTLNYSVSFRDKHPCETLHCLVGEAKSGDEKAQFELGSLSFHGIGGVLKDQNVGVRWFHLAAQSGNRDAEAMLAEAYFYGWSVEKNDDQAFKFANSASEKGSIIAKTMIAWLHLSGTGTEKNESLAAEIYLESAKAGYSYAQSAIAWMYEAGRGVDRNIEDAKKWYQQSADQGNSDAQIALAKIYLKNKNNGQDMDEVRELIKQSAQQGNEEANKLLSQLNYGSNQG